MLVALKASASVLLGWTALPMSFLSLSIGVGTLTPNGQRLWSTSGSPSSGCAGEYHRSVRDGGSNRHFPGVDSEVLSIHSRPIVAYTWLRHCMNHTGYQPYALSEHGLWIFYT